MAASSSNVLEFVREEDYVEYFLFPPKFNTPETEPSEENELNQVLVQINSIRDTFTKDYLWHKDSFRLSTRARHFNEHLTEEKGRHDRFLSGDSNKIKLPPFRSARPLSRNIPLRRQHRG